MTAVPGGIDQHDAGSATKGLGHSWKTHVGQSWKAPKHSQAKLGSTQFPFGSKNHGARSGVLKILYKLTRQGGYLFTTRGGTPLSIRNAQRDLAKLSERCGISGVRCSPHTMRHSFAVTYLRNGGNVEFLRRCLGHSNIMTTQRYLASVEPKDLQRIHNDLSPLGRAV
jgi:site-specific recombinase XerC